MKFPLHSSLTISYHIQTVESNPPPHTHSILIDKEEVDVYSFFNFISVLILLQNNYLFQGNILSNFLNQGTLQFLKFLICYFLEK